MTRIALRSATSRKATSDNSEYPRSVELGGDHRYLGFAFRAGGFFSAAFLVLAPLEMDLAVDLYAVGFEPGSTVATPGPGENRLSWPSVH